MSSILTKLNQIQKEREGRRNEKGAWIVFVVFFIVVLSLAAVNMHLFLLLKRYSAAQNTTSGKVTELSDTLNNNTQRLAVFSSDISKAMSDANRNFENIQKKIQEVDENILKLHSAQEAQQSGIDKITKNIDSLQKRIATLETAPAPAPSAK